MRYQIILILTSLCLSCSQHSGDIMGFDLEPISVESFSDSTRQIPLSESVLTDDKYFVWGGSVVEGEDGRYHMFYAIFDSGDSVPKFSDSWLLSSKIAYA
ncbi:MAG: hypothetical protein U9N86_10615, partial [Bacteroidota bacterium]|nr:hypothetical protein [Bacteroidota bacterium]